MKYAINPADNLRIRKTDADNVVTEYIFDIGGNVLGEKTAGSDPISYVYVNGRHVAMITGGETLYYGLNNVGSTVLLTNEAGEKVWGGEITPFGDTQTSEATVLAAVPAGVERVLLQDFLLDYLLLQYLPCFIAELRTIKVTLQLGG